ncbi:hypothetical protein AVEN_97741-1 [Araneus ventricosus]|uniref:Uncharacterized protein n=1 Tax=Araneus ventricosus TaxID=182803 RepID=A0A4Y2E2H4_ARAVE|nr:hypothetical protein AVEN_97741-1 [Araneus ventricosus]
MFEVWRWLPHMPTHCIDTLRGIVKCRDNSATTAIIAVRQVKPFEVGRERSMLKEEDNILSNPVSGTERQTISSQTLHITLFLAWKLTSASSSFHPILSSHSRAGNLFSKDEII